VERGGDLVSSAKYISDENQIFKIKYKLPKEQIRITSNESVNNLKPFELKFPMNTCIGIGGMSGSGKTTFIREILPKYIPNYKYISQKPIKGNSYSFLASYLGIIEKIRDSFSKVNKIELSVFLNIKGACKSCSGTGKVLVEEYNKRYSYICPVCNGNRYSGEVLKYKYFGLNIVEILNMEVDQAIEFFEKKNKMIYSKLNLAANIGLGYLKLNQAISTLSGGEAQRVKLLKNINIRKRNQFFALDEPFQGLNNTEIFNIMNVLYNISNEGVTFIIVEHNLLALTLCSYLIEFGPGSGNKGGRILYSGFLSDIGKSKESMLKKYL
jgi:excinuclease UvrABC ATPase subunit